MAGDDRTVSYEHAATICAEERDRRLQIDGDEWPAEVPQGWKPCEGGLRREIGAPERGVGDEGEGKGLDTPAIPTPIEEVMLRFPSAPIHALQRLHDHHVRLGPSENFHTMRVLRSAKAEEERHKVSRIFLMHTGLNELRTMGLYYRLASRLIGEDPGTVCIVRPFPGHLTRYPFQAFAETPLDNYLWDGSHLFRQFVRFMVETRWLLSALVRRSSYRCASGANLLCESDDVPGSRLESGVLATAMHEDWLDLHEASRLTAEAEVRAAHETGRPPLSEPAKRSQIADAIVSLRGALHLERDFEPHGGELGDSEEDVDPDFHVLGYSLGGFTAQSVFMSWPFLISSCSTLLAGGALRELAPTGFADPEEWQTVLHSLRYELDDRMMGGHLDSDRFTGAGPSLDGGRVSGLERDLFTYFKRTFYEVFQQEYRGSIQTRYEAFRERMLFIVGGDDPVVRPESVLQSGPKGGLNLLEIGGLGHFIGEERRGSLDRQQRNFWLPEMAALIHRFSENAAGEHASERPYTWFDREMSMPEITREEWNRASPRSSSGRSDEAIVRPLAPSELITIGPDGALGEEVFERCLDDLLHRTAIDSRGEGFLFLLRNEVPALLLPPTAVREGAAALYHDDLSIAKYCHGIAARREVLEDSIKRKRLCLVLPWNAREITCGIDLQRAYPSQAESAGGQVAERPSAEQVWEDSLRTLRSLASKKPYRPSVRCFDGRRPLPGGEGDLQDVIKAAGEFMRQKDYDLVPSLPDCWIWIAGRHASASGAEVDVRRGIGGLLRLAADVCSSSAKTLAEIENGGVRIVTVSRARYNPRFRGRLIVDGSTARKQLLHAALCVGLSSPIVGEAGELLLE
jgi:hypothetical protein